MRTIIAIAVIMIALAVQSCSARRSEPILGPLALEPHERRGQMVFMKNCNQCHPGGDAGLGPSINDKPLPHFMIRLQVRNGFGAMPAFRPNDISDEDVDALLQYLSALKHHG